jgi:hypothetical protein
MAEQIIINSMSEAHKKMIKEDMEGKKLYHDVLNCLGLLLTDRGEDINVSKLHPLPHYEEYLRNEEAKYPGLRDLIMPLSDLVAVAKFDQLIDKFNNDLDRIKRAKDYQACANFVKEIFKFVRG